MSLVSSGISFSFIYLPLAPRSLSYYYHLQLSLEVFAVTPPQKLNDLQYTYFAKRFTNTSRRLYPFLLQHQQQGAPPPSHPLFTTVQHIHNGKPTHTAERGAPQNAGPKENTLQLQGRQASTSHWRLKTHQRTWTPSVTINRQPQPFSWRWETQESVEGLREV